MIYKGNTPVSINNLTVQTKYGATAGSLLGDVDANGVLQMPSELTDLVFTGVKNIIAYGMYYKFYQNTGIRSVSFPDLTTLSNNSALYYCFRENSNLTTISFPELASITGSSVFGYAFYGCPLTTITFPKLADVSGASCLRYSLQACRLLTSLSFPALKTTSFGSNTTQFNSMFNSNTAADSGSLTVHFPSNLQSTISGLTGYPNFGANSSRITLLYDLPAT